MNLLQDREFKLKYEKSKYKVKIWESNFKKQNGHNPTKMDIRDAPPPIKGAYKVYYNMKTRLLEELDIAMCEDSENSTTENNEGKPSVKAGSSVEYPNSLESIEKVETQRTALADIQNCSETPDSNLQRKLPNKDTTFQSKVDSENDIWGIHLNKEKMITQKKASVFQRSFSSNFTEKLSKGAKFSTRNPRRTLTAVRSRKCLVSFNTLQRDTSCSTFSESLNANTVDSDSLSCSLPVVNTDNETNSTVSVSFLSELKTLKLVGDRGKSSNHPMTFIQKALSSTPSTTVPGKHINRAWLERCTDTTLDDSLSYLTDNAVDISLNAENQEKEKSSQENSILTCDIGSDEDVIYSSDSENSQSIFTLKRKSVFTSAKTSKESGNPCKKRKLDSTLVVPTQPNLNENTLQVSNDEEVNRVPKNVIASEKSFSFELPQSHLNELADQIIERKSTSAKKHAKVPNVKLSKKEILKKKLANGQANENFVRINIKKKVYVRGKKSMTFAKHKKLQWKANKKSAAFGEDTFSGGVMRCYNCGDVGHFSRNCQASVGDKLMPQDEDEDEESPFPTLEEAAVMASKANIPKRKPLDKAGNEDELSTKGVKIPADVLEALNKAEKNRIVEPLYPVGGDGALIEAPSEVYKALHEFGHDKFWPGQLEAVMRILSGLSTLVTLSTGAGKSLCYQLPALLYSRKSNCITLVVSPLVSLMEDQVTGLPKCIRVACLHANQSESQRSEVMTDAKAGNLDVLLVSPEAVMTGEHSRGFGSIIRDLPPIAFACIDEAHCLSQWSHNFRPSYLMISDVLRNKLGVRIFLGLTATATVPTCLSIAQHIGISNDSKGVIKDMPLPTNLLLSVSRDRRRDDALLALLSGTRYANCDSIIVYCTRRSECERLAVLIRTCLQEGRRPEENKIRCRASANAEPYHAGLSPARRKLIQRNFMSGKLRIVVATVAFGMGINKQDIRGIIHYNMPKNFESYVQEVGRAGRDGLLAQCHLFLDPNGGDLNELRRHIYANSVERHVIRKLLQRVFVPCRCLRLNKLLDSDDVLPNSAAEESKVQCPGHEVAFKIDETVRALDLPEENIATMLCYLELHPKKWIKVLSPVNTVCKVQSYKGPTALKAAARESPPLAMAVALDQKQGISHEKSNKVEFPVVDVAAALNWDSAIVKNHLKNLEWTNVASKWRRTGICVELSELGFRVQAPGNLSPEQLDQALELLHGRVEEQEHSCLSQLQAAFDAFTSVAYSSCVECMDNSEKSRSDQLKEQIRNYFQQDQLEVELKLTDELTDEEQVASDVRHLVCSYPDVTFTGRAVARIFHGIASPCFSPMTWGRCRFWRAHLDKDFKALSKVATREILQLK